MATFSLILSAATFLVPPSSASTEAKPAKAFVHADWWIEGGMFSTAVDSRIRIDGNRGTTGATIDMEDDLNLSDRELLLDLSLTYRGFEKWQIGLEWFNLKRGVAGALRKTVPLSNSTLLPVDAQYSAHFDIQVFRLSVARTLWTNGRTSVAFMFGIHGADTGAGIDAQWKLADGGLGDYEAEVSTGIILPLPNLGLGVSHNISDDLLVSARAEAFALDLGDYRGSLWNLGAGVRYRASRHLALGLGYNFFKLTFEMDRPQWDGKFVFSYFGPKVFAIYAF